MFTVGDYVVCGNNGICRVQDITTLNISGIDKSRKYYLLKPVFLSGSTVYIPVDTADEAMRKAMNKDEAMQFIHSIPNIPLIPLADEKTLERTYKEYMHQNSSYFKLAEDFLYGELSIALDMPKDEVRDYIVNSIEQ